MLTHLNNQRTDSEVELESGRSRKKK